MTTDPKAWIVAVDAGEYLYDQASFTSEEAAKAFIEVATERTPNLRFQTFSVPLDPVLPPSGGSELWRVQYVDGPEPIVESAKNYLVDDAWDGWEEFVGADRNLVELLQVRVDCGDHYVLAKDADDAVAIAAERAREAVKA